MREKSSSGRGHDSASIAVIHDSSDKDGFIFIVTRMQ